MALLKSIFINVYVITLVVVTVNAGLGYSKTLNLGWLGALMTAAPPLFLILSFLVFKNKPRTSAKLFPIWFLGALGLCFAAYKFLKGSGPELAFILAIIGFTTSLLYVFWYSHLSRTNSQLQLGGDLPDFSLETESGDNVQSKDWRGYPSILLFFRGNWCPLCMAQIKEISAQYKEISQRGAKVRLISPQSHKQTRALAKRFDVDMDFLVDKDLKAAKQLGLFSRFGTPMGMQALGYGSDTVLPTVIITDDKGKIIFLDETDNYRVRPEPSTFISVLDGLSAKPA